MISNEIHFVCADDTHGTPVMLRADKENITPEKLVDLVHKEHSEDFSDFNVSFDNFYSTNSIENKELSETIYKKLVSNNKIEKKEIEQFYDLQKEMFLPDRYIKGECPKCKAIDQYGDSCEECGATYSPTDLIKPYSVISGTPPIRKKTDHYFFKLSECTDFLEKWTMSGTLQPEASNKLKEWFKAGLSNWDISRDAPYFGFEIPEAPGKFFYVWLDAPIGYMASFKKLADEKNLSFDEYWKEGSDTELIHFIGKDILYFHALFWPATLSFSGFRVPSRIYAHGFLTVNGEKMSKSRGTFITARSYLNTIKNPDYLRYYYFSKLNDSMEDIDLNLEDFIVKVNSDLVGKFINIPSRTSGFIKKYFNNTLVSNNEISIQDAKVIVDDLIAIKDEVISLYEARLFSKLNRLLMSYTEKVNEYVNRLEPWVLAKNIDEHKPMSQLHQVCSAALQAFRVISIYYSPIMPDLTHKIAEFYGESNYQSIDAIHENIKNISDYSHLLTRLDKDAIDLMLSQNSS
jgi:methionyl-tRNA synthetase